MPTWGLSPKGTVPCGARTAAARRAAGDSPRQASRVSERLVSRRRSRRPRKAVAPPRPEAVEPEGEWGRRARGRQPQGRRARGERAAATELDPDLGLDTPRHDVDADERAGEGDPRGADATDGRQSRGPEDDVGAVGRPRRALRDETYVVLGAWREAGDGLRDGDGSPPRAEGLDDRPGAVGRRLPELEPGARRPADRVDRPGERHREPGRRCGARRGKRAGARPEAPDLAVRRACVAPRGDR